MTLMSTPCVTNSGRNKDLQRHRQIQNALMVFKSVNDPVPENPVSKFVT